jgi:hypothetical protein
MTVVISAGLVASLSRAIIGSDANGNNPIIGYDNLVTTGNITSTTEAASFPVVNLANPLTHQYWLGVIGSPNVDEYITVVVDTAEEIDYVGIAGHNFGSGLIPVSIEVQATSVDAFVEVIADLFLPDDGPAIFRFTPQSAYAVRVRLQPSQLSTPVAPQAAVLYIGKLLILQRRIYIGHTPINYGRETRVITGKSESGNFLGRIITGENRSTAVSMTNLTPAWYRTYLDPFISFAQRYPFFFAWRPLDYPYETGFAWITDSPKPSNQRGNGMVQISFQMMGIV